MNRRVETFRIVWRGIAIDVRWEPNWLNLSPCVRDTAHLEVESVAPEGAPLPITETGYRSHFTSSEAVAAYGGPVAFCRGMA